jgi:Glycosyl transferases group 1
MISLFKGGPRTVGLGILEGIKNINDHKWVLLLPSKSGYEEFIENSEIKDNHNITVIYCRYPNVLFKPAYRFYYENIYTAIYYYFNSIDMVFMTGNFICGFIKANKQIVLEHNSLYFEKYSKNFDNNLVKYHFGKFLLKITLIFKPKLLVQLLSMKNKIIHQYGYSENRIKVVTMVPVSYSVERMDRVLERFLFNINLFKDKIKYFFPANYYPGKNHKILIPLAELIKKNKYNIVIFITLPENCEFLNELRLKNFDNVIINIGYVDHRYMSDVYKAIDYLFFPSYAESYGMPYVEAIKNHTPIITADYEFSREICQSGAIYFDQDNINSLDKAIILSINADVKATLLRNIDFEKGRFDHGWSTIVNNIFDLSA